MDVDGHLQPPVQAVDVVLKVEDEGEVDELFAQHDVRNINNLIGNSQK